MLSIEQSESDWLDLLVLTEVNTGWYQLNKVPTIGWYQLDKVNTNNCLTCCLNKLKLQTYKVPTRCSANLVFIIVRLLRYWINCLRTLVYIVDSWYQLWLVPTLVGTHLSWYHPRLVPTTNYYINECLTSWYSVPEEPSYQAQKINTAPGRTIMSVW
jgi:hypothetical protein